METNNIEESYCSLEVSRLLKEKGFKVPVQSCYDGSDCVASYTPVFDLKNYNVGGGKNTSRPTHDVAIKWIRTNLNWHVELIWDILNDKKVWFTSISKMWDLENDCIDLNPKGSTEEAIEEALLYILKKEKSKKLYTENEVEELLSTQRGNCYVAILTETKDENLAKIANSAPEPSGGKWRKN